MIRIKTATKADIEALARVEIESKLHSLPRHIDMASIDHAARVRQWTTYFDGETPVSAKPERIVFKAMDGEKVVGLIAGHLTNRYGKDAEIQKIYVLKEEQRKGIGSELLKALLQWLNKQDAQSFCVGIDPKNPYQVFYFKYGGVHLNEHWIFWDDLEIIEEKLKLSVKTG